MSERGTRDKRPSESDDSQSDHCRNQSSWNERVEVKPRTYSPVSNSYRRDDASRPSRNAEVLRVDKKFSRTERHRSSSSSSSSSENKESSKSSSKGKCRDYRRKSSYSKSSRSPDRYRRSGHDKRYRNSSFSSSSSEGSDFREKKYNRRGSPDGRARKWPDNSKYHSSSKKKHSSMGASSDSVNHPLPVVSQFKNDGSFLEMFKKMQEAQQKGGSTQSTSQADKNVEQQEQIKKPTIPLVGKRRGGRVLKTGMVKKSKPIEEQTVDSTPGDAWSLYLKEVKKYRETSCEEEGKTRPLVK